MDTETLTLPLLPLPSGVVFPHMVVTLALESAEATAAADGAQAADGRLLLVPRTATGYATVGAIARIEHAGELPNGSRGLVLRGTGRAVVGSVVPDERAGVWVSASVVADDGAQTGRARELATEYKAVVRAIARQLGSPRVAEIVAGVDDIGALADTAGASPELSLERRIVLLETLDAEARLGLALEWAREALAELELGEELRTRVTDNVDKTQREFLLRQQLAAIRAELGEGDDDGVDEYRSRLDGRVLPDAVRTAVEREIGRLERTSEQNPEHGWIRTWLDTVFELPWGERSEDQLDVVGARAVLDADHTGLDDVKDRIVEHLAVRKLRATRTAARADTVDVGGRGAEATRHATRGDGAILALVGPPGTGKTSLGESVARALGRTFVRVALGGVHDEAELRGHRRTYVGARPGRIARALAEAGTMNPVLLLDEVDKVGADWRGDPASALLEILDPAQNHTFRDHYLEVDLDLSDVLFLATANVLETIPGPLLDRLEVLRLDGYSEDEKVVIAREHLVARQRERNGLLPGEVSITDDALRRVVEDYTREAGVRGLERQIATLLRKTAAQIAERDENGGDPVVVDADDVAALLGRPRFFAEVAERSGRPGVATGLAVTGVGGDVLFVETTAMDGEPGLTLTGQLGDVMKESAHIARSFVRANAERLGIDPATLDRHLHVHVPAGAVPKDGPSAGVTITTALVSLLTGRPVRADVGMTGEVTLQGRVLPIGGVKQKVLAAQRAGLTTVILPRRNGPDLDDVPPAVREAMTFHLADGVDDVLAVALDESLARAA